MKKIHSALTIIAVLLSMISVQGQINSTSKKHSLSNMGNKSERETQSISENKKILVAYFSHSGNTREIANQIYKNTGGNIFEIQPVKPYPQDYDAVVKQAQEEQAALYKPALKSKIGNIKSYDIVFIGYPNWWGTIPPPVRTFLSTYDFSGKTIVPFCTHEGSGLGRSVTEISKLCPKSTILNGLAIRGGNVHKAQNEVYQWLHKIKSLDRI